MDSIYSGNVDVNSPGLHIGAVAVQTDYPSKGWVTITITASASDDKNGSFDLTCKGSVTGSEVVTEKDCTITSSANDTVGFTEGTDEYVFAWDAATDLGTGYAFDDITLSAAAHDAINQGGNATDVTDTHLYELNWNYWTGDDITLAEPDRAEDYEDGFGFEFTPGTLVREGRVNFRINVRYVDDQGTTQNYYTLLSQQSGQGGGEVWKKDGVTASPNTLTIGESASIITVVADALDTPTMKKDFTIEILSEIIPT